MTTTTNDIDAMLRFLRDAGFEGIHAALTALVAERDALKRRVAELKAQPDTASDLRDAEGGGVSDIVERLRYNAEINDYNPSKRPFVQSRILREAADEIERLRAELAAMRQQRDEARQEICEFVAESDEASTGFTCTAEQIAAKRGWDCFAQQEGGGA